jgi:hypothetical protein
MLGIVSSLGVAAVSRSMLLAGTEPSTPTTVVTPATTTPPVGGGGDGGESGNGLGSSVVDVISTMWDNLNTNLYQTGTALIVATIAIIVMRNMKTPPYILVPVAIGAFWAGWLGWNTVTAQDNPLFPGDIDATKIWDVAFTGETGFLIAVIAACVAAIFLWRSKQPVGSRIVLIVGSVLGASFIYNLVEAIRFEAT